MLAREAEGSMRDAESLLDQVMSAATDHVDENLVAEVLGLFDRRFLFDCIGGLLSGDADKSLEIVDQVHTFGFDLKPFTRDLLEIVRHLNVIKVAAKPGRLMDVSAEEFQRLSALAGQTSRDVLARHFSLLLQGYEEVTRSQAPRLALEMTLLKMARVQPVQPLDELLERLNTFERTLRRSGLASARRVAVPASAPPAEPQPKPGGAGPVARAPRTDQHRPPRSAAEKANVAPAPRAPDAEGKHSKEAEPTRSPRRSEGEAAPEAPPTAEQPVKEPGAARAEGVPRGQDKTWHGFLAFWYQSSEGKPAYLQRARIISEKPGKVVLGVARKLELSRTNEELRKPKTQALLQRYYGRKVLVTCQAINRGEGAPSYQEVLERRQRAHKQQLLDKLRADERVHLAARVFGVDEGAIEVETEPR